jgi:S-DNA-T family DNA segregation ATPase FtsK/SpoIIIE
MDFVPSVALLGTEKGRGVFTDPRNLAKDLLAKLDNFGVRGKVIKIVSGAAVTQIRFRLDEDVKYSTLLRLKEDIALALKAKDVLISRIPGTNLVSIEIESSKRGIVPLRKVLESEEYYKDYDGLRLALGLQIRGDPVVMDLTKAPHLLIAGTTGSGKSICLHSILLSLLFFHTPLTAELVLIDPKKVELSAYSGIPHLRCGIATTVSSALQSLQYVRETIKYRYELFELLGVRDIKSYNSHSERESILPYQIVVIDEFSELMLSSKREVEESVVRIAQLGRACGVHIIIATQRPTVDTVTGLIKANIQTRISFRVASKMDSRVILDSNGAESLLGRGDALIRLADSSELVRMQGAYTTPEEVDKVVNELKLMESKNGSS